MWHWERLAPVDLRMWNNKVCDVRSMCRGHRSEFSAGSSREMEDEAG